MRTDHPPIRSGLHKKLLFHIAFLAVVFLTMAIEVTLFFRGPRFAGAFRALLPDRVEQVDSLVGLAVLKVCVMLLILLAALALVMLLALKRVALPLGKILAGARAIRSGDLSTTIPVEGDDELAQLALCVNELSANLQEVSLLARSVSQRARGDLERLRNAESPEAAIEATGDIDDALGQLDALLSDFAQQVYVSVGQP